MKTKTNKTKQTGNKRASQTALTKAATRTKNGIAIVNALNDMRTNGALKTSFLSILLVAFIFNSTASFAMVNSGNFVVRQETQRTGSVLVCRPVSEDLKITRIISENNIKSVEDYAMWLQGNVVYKSDNGVDIWASVEETLKSKNGDCEDYAFLTASVLRVMGYKPRVLVIGETSQSQDHAVCVFEKNGRYLWFDNAELKLTSAPSLTEFARHIFTKYDSKKIGEINTNTKQYSVLFVKASA